MSDYGGDPMTDPQAAAAFTKDRAWTPHWGHQRVRLAQTWDGKNKGKPLCRASVHDEGRSVGFHQCPLPGRVQTADGAWWCRVHEPAAVAARKAVQDAKFAAYQAKFRAQMDADRARRQREAAYPQILAALEQIANGHNDPRGLALEVLGALSAVAQA